MSSTYTTLNGKRGTPYNTRLGSGYPLIQQPRSTPPSTPISTIPKYPYSIRNHQPAQASNARIPWPNDSTELECVRSSLIYLTIADTCFFQNDCCYFIPFNQIERTIRLLLLLVFFGFFFNLRVYTMFSAIFSFARWSVVSLKLYGLQRPARVMGSGSTGATLFIKRGTCEVAVGNEGVQKMMVLNLRC